LAGPGRRAPRRRSLWQRLKRLLGLGPPDEPPAPPDDEPALVPAGPRPTAGGGAEALELQREPEEVDARGREG
jgi:hypothetical protein